MPMTQQDVVMLNRMIGRGYDTVGVPRSLNHREFFEISMEMGFNQLNPDYRKLHENLATWVANNLKVKSSLEIGCGPGYLMNCLNVLGVDAVGIDGNPYSQRLFQTLHPSLGGKYIKDEDFSGEYSNKDLLIAIEVFEHIDDNGLQSIMKKVNDRIQPKFIVFSSTPYADAIPSWDVQWGHINIKQPNEWRAFFESHGYLLNERYKPPVTEWAVVYEQKA